MSVGVRGLRRFAYGHLCSPLTHSTAPTVRIRTRENIWVAVHPRRAHQVQSTRKRRQATLPSSNGRTRIASSRSSAMRNGTRLCQQHRPRRPWQRLCAIGWRRWATRSRVLAQTGSGQGLGLRSDAPEGAVCRRRLRDGACPRNTQLKDSNENACKVVHNLKPFKLITKSCHGSWVCVASQFLHLSVSLVQANLQLVTHFMTNPQVKSLDIHNLRLQMMSD